MTVSIFVALACFTSAAANTAMVCRRQKYCASTRTYPVQYHTVCEKKIVFFRGEWDRSTIHSTSARPTAEISVFVCRLGLCSPDNMRAYITLTAKPSIRPVIVAGSVTIRNHRVLASEVLPVFFKASTTLKSFLRQVRHAEVI